jgi:hypothetical protein
MSTFNETSGAPRGEQCQCPTCGLLFTGDQSFMRHRTGRYRLPLGHPEGRRCMSASEMRLAGMEQTVAGLWRVRRGSNVCTEASEARAEAGPGARTNEHLRTPQNPSVHNTMEAA